MAQALIARALIARVVVRATRAVHTGIFRTIRYLANPVPSRKQNGRGLWLQNAGG